MDQSKGEVRRETLLATIADKGGSASTTELKDATGWKGNLIGHHLRTLRGSENTTVSDVDQNDPQVEVIGTEARDGQQMDANIYGITEAGKSRLQESAIPTEELLDQRRVEDLRRDLRKLESDFEEFREGYNNLVNHLRERGVVE